MLFYGYDQFSVVSCCILLDCWFFNFSGKTLPIWLFSLFFNFFLKFAFQGVRDNWYRFFSTKIAYRFWMFFSLTEILFTLCLCAAAMWIHPSRSMTFHHKFLSAERTKLQTQDRPQSRTVIDTLYPFMCSFKIIPTSWWDLSPLKNLFSLFSGSHKRIPVWNWL